MPSFRLHFTTEASAQLEALSKSDPRRHRKVKRTLGILETRGTRHNSFESHEIESMSGPKGERIWEIYAENRTPNAHRIFLYYGPAPARYEITIMAITGHL